MCKAWNFLQIATRIAVTFTFSNATEFMSLDGPHFEIHNSKTNYLTKQFKYTSLFYRIKQPWRTLTLKK